VAGKIRSIEKCNDLIGNRTRDLRACSKVPQPTTLPRAPIANNEERENNYEVVGRTLSRLYRAIETKVNKFTHLRWTQSAHRERHDDDDDDDDDSSSSNRSRRLTD
jgi:hypothetical protein